MAPRQHAGHLARKRPNGSELRDPVERHYHVQTSAAGCHDGAGKPQLIEQVVKHPSRFARLGEPVGRVEIEDQAIGVAGLVGPAEPDMRRDTALICEIDQGGRVIAQYVGHPPAGFAGGWRAESIRETSPRSPSERTPLP